MGTTQRFDPRVVQFFEIHEIPLFALLYQQILVYQVRFVLANGMLLLNI